MKKLTLTLISLLCWVSGALATGEPSTYFNIYIPPNNEIMSRDVCLIVTALYDSTSFSIVDDGADGDADDSKSGMLMQGQSYVLYIRNNGVNDDAPHSGESTTKQDGDYFKITSNKLVFASQATLSGWQHDWVASFNKSSKGEKFIVYSNPSNGSSVNDLNVMAYEDSTMVVVKKVSTSALTGQGYTNVDMKNGKIVLQKMIHRGKDLIYYYNDGKDLLKDGETYLVETNKPVTIQYGALAGGNERDGGGYVPSSNGSSSGSLFYFTVPYQSSGEQEIRIVSWDSDNNVLLERYNGSSWSSVKSYSSVGKMKPVDWVGAVYGQTYANVFRVTCTEGKKVSVLEANWMETGSPGTSDMATMVSSDNGTSSGRSFLVYMPPPGNENRVTDPFTGKKLSQNVHAYVFAKDSSVITVKDAYTGGTKLSRTYTVAAGRYADVNLTLSEWKSIYNGTGTTSGGPERPYILIQSTGDISVMVSNSNDNWMMYFGSSLEQGITQATTNTRDFAKPGDTVTVTSTISIPAGGKVTSPKIDLNISEGATTVHCKLKDSTTGAVTSGTITVVPKEGTHISIPGLTSLDSSHCYKVETRIVVQPVGSDGKLIANNDLITVDMTVSGYAGGNFQQSSSSTGIVNQSYNTSNYAFSIVTTGNQVTDTLNAWNSYWVDMNKDYYPDLFVPAYDKQVKSCVYINKKDGTFSKQTSGNALADAKDLSIVAAAFGDLNNDDKMDIITGANLGQSCVAYQQNSSDAFVKKAAGDISSDKGYAQAISLADYDNDGFLDAFVAEYFPSSFGRLYHNKGDGTFTKVTSGDITQIANYTNGSTWADYDNDGRMDLFVPVSGTVATTLSKKNFLFHNEGNGVFTKVTSGDVVNDEGNSTASAWGDYDNDGFLDLFVSNASNEKCNLYHNNGNGTFSKITTGNIVNDKGDWHGCQWLDYDNDGYLDLYLLSNDSTEAKRLYHNNGDGTFTNKPNEIVCASFKNSISASCADYDKDGFPDLYVTTTGKLPNYMFHNNGNKNKWISILLQGQSSNHSGIGARIKLKATIGGKATWQSREVGSSSGLGSQNSLNACFGLGDAATIDSVIIRWPSGVIQYHTSLSTNQFLLIKEQSAGTVKGIAFYDENTSCDKDKKEAVIKNMKFKIMPGNIYATTSDSGSFAVLLPLGTYTISQETSSNWANSCTSSYTVKVTNTGVVNATVYFANKPKKSGTDLFIQAGASAARRGFTNQLSIDYGNLGDQSYSGGEVKVTLPSGMYMKSATPAWSAVTGNTYIWHLTPLAMGTNNKILAIDSVGLTYKKGDTFTVYTTISRPLGELDTTNNAVALKGQIMGAVDPNEIRVDPPGVGEEGYINRGEALTYTVDFENIGDYEAEKVTIECTIPDGMDISSLELAGASHSCSYTLEGRLLRLYFDQIHLPVKTEGSKANQGFVAFTLKQLPDVAPGFTIINKADIVFDYEEPMGTNQVRNTIWGNANVRKRNQIAISPNPLMGASATIKATADMADIKLKDVSISSLDGRLIFSRNDLDTWQLDIDRELFPITGMYMIFAHDYEGNSYSGMIDVR